MSGFCSRMIMCAASVLTSLKATDIVHHGVLDQKLAGLRLPEQIYADTFPFK